MGPRTHEVHVTAEHVDQLGQLVEPEAPEPPSAPRDPVRVVPLPLGVDALDRMHRAELDQVERQPVEPCTLLDEEDRTAGVQLDRERDHGHHGGQHDQAGDGDEEAERPGERGLEARRRVLVREDDAARRHQLEGELAGQAFVRLDGVLDPDAARPRLDEMAERHPPAPVREPDDDPVRSPLGDEAIEFGPVLDHADEGVAMGAPGDLLDDQTRQRARPDDQQALAESAKLSDAAVHAGSEDEGQDEEAREQRAVSEPNLGQELVGESQGVHTRAAIRNARRVSTRRAARSQRTGPSLSGSCRTTGPSSSRSARTVTGDALGGTKSASTGTAPSER